ncbi:MAG: iron-containing alcohol dehydrogenase [Thermoanaerobaculia bacterium]
MIGFRMPTRVHIAPGCLARLPEAVRSLDAESVLLVVDPGLQATEWPRKAQRALTENDVRCEVFDAVEANPRTSTATAAAETIRGAGLKGVVALGGGSVLDTAKAAAMLAANEGRIEHLEGKNRYSRQPLPMVAIPTTCGTGSEVTWVSVLTHRPTRTKISVKGETMFPDQALVDAELIRTLPSSMVAATGFDALTHALEATTCRAANPVSDALAEKAIALLFRYLARAAEDVGGDAEAREAVMRASTVAGLAFGNADVAGVHCLSESLGGLFDVPHGVTNAILVEPVLRHHRPAIESRLADLDLMLSPPDGEASADHFFAALGDLRRQLGIPGFAALKIPREGYPEVAAAAARNNSNGSNPQPMGAGDYLRILESLD